MMALWYFLMLCIEKSVLGYHQYRPAASKHLTESGKSHVERGVEAMVRQVRQAHAGRAGRHSQAFRAL